MNNGNQAKKILYAQTKAFLMAMEKAEGLDPYVINRGERYLLSILREMDINPVTLAKQIEKGQLDVNSLI